MNKKIPNIFKGKAPKNVNQVSSVIKKDEIVEKDYEKSVDEQIKDVFRSDKFVYKSDTLITMTNGDVIKKTIIGKTNNSLITIDDELIDVSKISKIELL